MSEQDNINRIEQEIRDLQSTAQSYKEKQNICPHKWSAAVYDPETVMNREVILGDFSECHGSDYYPATRLVSTEKPRWTKTCENCGKKEHTFAKN